MSYLLRELPGTAVCCCQDRGAATETRDIELIFKREELLYDINNYAWIEGHVMGEENQHAQHTLTDIGEEGNIDRVTRILGIAHAAAVEILYPYTKQEAEEGEEIDDKMWEPEEYRIKMTIPATMSRTTLHLMSKLIHEFMVCRVLHDWLSITWPESSIKWLEKSKEAEAEIKKIKSQRTKAFRRASHPF